MRDEILPIGTTKASKPDAGGANIRSVPVFGVVKNNVDPIKAGRIQVYIADWSGTDPNDPKNWVTVSYMTPFYGVTSASSPNTGYGTFKNNSHSYGMWYSPPDIGTTVVCLFINGDMNYGYYIGSVPKPEALRMVPAIGSNFSNEDVIFNDNEAQSYGGSEKLPVTNMNTNNSGLTEKPEFINTPKPIHSYVASIMQQQGILRDFIRGPISTSAQRESPSRVGWGVSTPGRPIYEGGFTDENVADAANNEGNAAGLNIIARRGGHSIVMDDGDIIGRDQLIRIRTALGHQILMSDDGQTLMILHSNGQSYIELGKEGTVDIFSTNSFNVRTQGDINLHADNNINIHAQKSLNIQANDIKVSSDTTFEQRTTNGHKVYVGGTFLQKVNGAMAHLSAGEASFESSGLCYVNGEKIYLNTGTPSNTPQEVEPIAVQAHTDTLFDSVKGYAAAPGKLISITSRAPAHTPWSNANQGVNIKTSLSAAQNLPEPATSAVQATNTATQGATDTNLTSTATVTTVPTTQAVSNAIDVNATAGLISAQATNAAAGPGIDAINQGVAKITDPTGNTVVVVGQLAQTAQQLENAGYLKPGSSVLVNSLAASDRPIKQSLSNSLWTGKPGGENLTNFTNNTIAQVDSAVQNLKQAQSGLTNAGIVTGNESATAIGGVVLAAANSGVAATVDTVKNLAQNTSNTISNLTSASGAANAVVSQINSGNFATGVAAATNATGAIASAVSSMPKIEGIGGAQEAAAGAAASAFKSITDGFKSFKSGIPQNLKSISDLARGEAAAIGSTLSNGSAANAVSTVTSIVSQTGNLVNASNASATASGLNVLPGGQNAVSTIVNQATGAINNIPGTQIISQTISAVGTAQQVGTSVAGIVSTTNNPVTTSSNVVNTVAGNVTGTLNKLKSEATKLSTAALTGLPAAAASKLQSTIASITSGGGLPIKIPDVGINTVDRSSITSQITNVLKDAKIPKPNFTGVINPVSVSAIQKQNDNLLDKVTRYKEFEVEKNQASKDFYTALAKFNELKNTLPEGDPQIAEAKKVVEEKFKISQAAFEKSRAILDGTA